MQAYRDFSVRLKRTGIFLYVQNSPGIFLYVQKSTGSFLYVLTWPIFGIAADGFGAVDFGLLLMVPGALFEVTFAFWLIVDGFCHEETARR